MRIYFHSSCSGSSMSSNKTRLISTIRIKRGNYEGICVIYCLLLLPFLLLLAGFYHYHNRGDQQS